MKLKKVFTILFCVIAVLFICGLLFAAVTIARSPDLDTVSASPDGYQTTLLDDEGNVMRTVAGVSSNRVYVSLDEIPDDLENAFIAIEDSRFYSHCGIDLKSIARAAFKCITTGSFSQGGSTITQQLLKNNVFTNWTEEETMLDKIQRKIQEQYLAIRLEQQQSKEWILENYLNTINLGNGSWGVEVASEVYFGTDVGSLDLAQCALIAGITNNPSGYNPLKHPAAALERQHLVLEAMLAQGYISESRYESAMSEDVLSLLTSGSTSDDDVYTYFEDAVLTEVKEDLMNTYDYTSDEAWNLIYSGGLTICTTEDPDVQEVAENAAAEADLADDSQQISIVITDPSTGQVKAIVGGSGTKSGSLVLNRATDSLRQPGSTIKIIGEYAAGIDSGLLSLGTVYDDAPVSYSNGTEIQNASHSYSGKTTVRQAITDSLNTVAYKAFREVGQTKVMDYLERFGISTLSGEDNNEALALGGTSSGVTDLEMTAAYGAIANGGTYISPVFYTRVLDRDGNELLTASQETHTAVSSATAALLTSAMEDVITSGTGTAASYSSSLPIAGKTGTTSDMKDVWMIGFSPYFTCGIWGGYDDNTAQESSTYVKTLWKNIMSQINSNYLYKDFAGSDNLVTADICTKCGGLAVAGLCDSTVQGDMTRTEYFTQDTVPTSYCSCHQSVTICSESGQTAGSYCPQEDLVTKVYLISGTEGTDDASAVIPADTGITCETHTSFWDSIMDGLFGESEETESEEDDYRPDTPEDQDHDDGRSFWDWFGY